MPASAPQQPNFLTGLLQKVLSQQQGQGPTAGPLAPQQQNGTPADPVSQVHQLLGQQAQQSQQQTQQVAQQAHQTGFLKGLVTGIQARAGAKPPTNKEVTAQTNPAGPFMQLFSSLIGKVHNG